MEFKNQNTLINPLDIRNIFMNTYTIGDTITFKTHVRDWDILNLRWVMFDYSRATGTVYGVNHHSIDVLAGYGIIRILYTDIV